MEYCKTNHFKQSATGERSTVAHLDPEALAPRLMPKFITTACAALLISGCTTTLTSTGVTNLEKTVKGQIYYLPHAVIQVSVTRELKSCEMGYASEADAAVVWLTSQLALAIQSDTAEDAAAIISAIRMDPILERGDVVAAIGVRASDSRWESALKLNTQAAPSPASGGQAKRAKKAPRQEADLKAIQALAARLQANAPTMELKFEVEISAQASPEWAADVDKVYSIDYDGMQNGLKGTEYAVETYPNGTLKSINVTIDDQTGQFVQKSISGIAKLAAASGGFPLAPVTAQGAKAGDRKSFKDWQESQTPPAGPCKPDMRLKLLQRPALEAQLQTQTESLIAETKRAGKLEANHTKSIAAHEKAKNALKALDTNDPKKAEAEALVKQTESDMKLTAKAVLDAKESLAELSQGVEKVGARVSTIRKALSTSWSATFRPDTTTRSIRIEGELEALKAWLTSNQLAACAGNPVQCGNSDLDRIVALLQVHAGISAATPTKSDLKALDTSSQGIFYRQPLKGTLVVCKGQPCLTGSSVTAPREAVILTHPVDLPQLGALGVLPLVNAPFQNNSISATFSESGALTKVTYKSNAAAVKAAEVFESSADSILKFREAKRSQEASKLAATAAELDAQKKVIDAQLALEKAQSDLTKFRDSQKTAP